MSKQSYKERLDQQTLDWVNGKPTHNTIDDECCPDFSCCVNEITTCAAEKQAFLDAFRQGNTDITNGMLMMFLSQLLAVKCPSKNVHVAGFQND